MEVVFKLCVAILTSKNAVLDCDQYTSTRNGKSVMPKILTQKRKTLPVALVFLEQSIKNA